MKENEDLEEFADLIEGGTSDDFEDIEDADEDEPDEDELPDALDFIGDEDATGA